MRILYVYCHPLPESFHAGLRAEALAGLAEAGHEVDLLDLYAEGFDPILSDEGGGTTTTRRKTASGSRTMSSD